MQVRMALTSNSLARRKSRVQIPPPPPHIEHDRGTLVMLVLLYAFSCTQGGVVDAVPTRDHGVDQGQQLAPRMGGASPLAQVDQRIGGLLDAQPLGQRGRQQQPRVGDRVGVVEAGVELVEGVGGCLREPALLGSRSGSRFRRLVGLVWVGGR
jgi:hypothetical protein